MDRLKTYKVKSLLILIGMFLCVGAFGKSAWIFEEDSFVPQAKLVNGKSYSIITDHLGTPVMAVDSEGEKVWSRELDIYGKTRTETGKSNFVPFLYQGQYYDEEIGLAYNRFRYYSPDSGTYISQDPISIAGGLNTYAYVPDVNSWIDPLGLAGRRGNQATRDHIEVVKKKFMADNPGAIHIGGGLDDAGNQLKEVYIPPTNKIPGSTKGGSYADLTFETADGTIVHINTVDKGNYNGSGMSKREYINAKRIQTDAPDAKVKTIGKGDSPGDLSMSKRTKMPTCG